MKHIVGSEEMGASIANVIQGANDRLPGTPTVSLNWLAKAQEITENLATPHRLFDVESVRKDAGTDNPQVALKNIFVECANTGVRSPLDRFFCTVIGKNGQATNVTFMVDLIQGFDELYRR